MKPTTLKKSCLAGAKNTQLSIRRQQIGRTLNSRTPISNSGTPVPEFVHEGIHLRLCRNAKPRRGHAQLYCSRDGRFFSVTRRSVNQVKPSYTPERPAKKTGGCAQYMFMQNFGTKACHILIYEAWVGERTPGMQIDHIDGVPTNNHADNLQEVTPAENYRRRSILRRLRKAGMNPAGLTTKRLLAFFAMPEDRFDRWLTDWTKRQADLAERELSEQTDPILYHLSQSPDEC